MSKPLKRHNFKLKPMSGSNLSLKLQQNHIKKLEGLEGYRLRIGDYRIIYKIENQECKILIIAIDVRGEVYK